MLQKLLLVPSCFEVPDLGVQRNGIKKFQATTVLCFKNSVNNVPGSNSPHCTLDELCETYRELQKLA